jgi:periplasmic copper chaperone A
MKAFVPVLLLALACGASQAQTTVTDPWVRATVAQQKASGLFARIVSVPGARLLSASSPVAGVVEIHEMKMDGDVMRMRALPQGLALPAGQAVELKPGGYHLMLMDLKQPLKPGDTVAVTLVLEGADKKRESLVVQAPVKAMGSDAPMMHKH